MMLSCLDHQHPFTTSVSAALWRGATGAGTVYMHMGLSRTDMLPGRSDQDASCAALHVIQLEQGSLLTSWWGWGQIPRTVRNQSCTVSCAQSELCRGVWVADW